MKISRRVMLGEVPKWCLLVVTLTLGVRGESPCRRGHTWWHRARGACVPCTRCEPRHAVVLPCELHRDTTCRPLQEINIFPFSDTNTSDSDYEYDYYEDYEVTEDENVKWDVQSTTLTLAASGCVIFFVVVLYLSFHHSKQWKVLKLALRSDVQDLSAKLKLMEAGDVVVPAEPLVATDHHIYCNIHVAKDTLLGPASKKKGLGNVYTQEKHSS